MSAILRGVMSRSAPVLRSNAQQRTMAVVSGPPRVRIPFAEKVATGVIMTLLIISPMSYIMANLLKYRGERSD